mgnify:FL=1
MPGDGSQSKSIRQKTAHADVIVVGGGLCGSLTALQLAAGGLRVVLLDRVDPRRAAQGRLEGLSARASDWLLGQDYPEVAALQKDEVPRQVQWGEMRNSLNREVLVDRAALDAALRRQAAESGAGVVMTGARSPSASRSTRA